MTPSALALTIPAWAPEVAARVLDWAARQHPFAVHFPIALLLSGALLEYLLCLHRREDWIAAQRFCLRLGGWTALAAAGLGWLQADRLEPDPAIELHRWLALAALSGAILCALTVPRWPESERGRFRWLLTLTVLAVGGAALFGAYLVHGPDQFVI